MTTTTTIPKGLVSTINTFVKSFLSGEDASVEAWTSPANQKLLKASLLGKKPVRGGGEQKKKDKPKKSKSAYLYFCDEERSRIKQAQPDLTSTQITVLLGQRWKALKEDSSRTSELASYEKKASADNERYMKEKGEKKSKKEDKPKKAKSAYLVFCEQTRPLVKKEMPNLAAKEIISELARRWQLQKQ